MDGVDSLHRFYFNHNLLLHQNVDSITTLRTHPLVFHRDGYLPNERYAAQLQFTAEALLINRLQKAGPQAAMNFDRSRNDYAGSWIARS